MDTDLEAWGLSPADDAFHLPNDDPWWTETAWFAWFVPERNLVGYFYPIFRPNKGIQAGGMIVYDDTAELPWELPVFDYDWHHAIPEDLDLRDARLDNGMRLRCLEPSKRFELAYEGRDLSLSLHAEGVVRPLVTMAEPPFNKGHIDQLCRVTGEMELFGESIPVDCIAMRDRSWGPRQDGRQPTVGYAYGAQDPENAFLAVAVADRSQRWMITTGFLQRDGLWSRLVSGERTVQRDDEGRPVNLHIEATDESGRALSAHGEVRSRQVFTSYPSMFCWNGLVDWRFDGARGFGEDQDVWHPRRWRRFKNEWLAVRANRP